MQKVNWGIIGCGNVTEVKSGPAFNLINDSELIAVMRRSSDKAQNYAKRHNVPKWYSNANDLINDNDVNAIYVATPPDTHCEYAILAMRSGKPVYVEKPMARNYNEAMQMLAVSEETGVPLYVAYYRRSLPGFKKVKEIIDNRQIGTVRCINIQLYKSPSEDEIKNRPGWRVNPEISGGGHFFDLASHQLDYLDYVFGPVTEINSVAINQSGLYKAEDYVSASFSFENNVVCSGTWCFSASKEANRDSIEIIGDKGVVSFSCFGFTPVKLVNEDGIKEFDYPRPDHVQYNLIKEVVEELLGKGKSPSTGKTAARTSKVLDTVVANYYGHH